MYGQASSSRPPALPGPTEFEILKASHKFLREDEDAGETNGSWGDRIAQKYYASLYREFAVCDLKHYKSGNLALRWRTEAEVLSGAGEETCGNTRCPLHGPSSSPDSNAVGLKTVELPFAYEENGEHKSALVKVVLCDSCLKKLTYKREKETRKERKEIEAGREEGNDGRDEQEAKNGKYGPVEDEHDGQQPSRQRERHEEQTRKRKKSHSRSRSQSPSHRRKREHKDKHKRHDHSPS